jgi:hypothetical protein
MVERHVCSDKPDERPSIVCHEHYRRAEHIDIKGDFTYVQNMIKKYMKQGVSFPGFKMTFLGEDIYTFQQDTKEAEPNFLTVKVTAFQQKREDAEVLTLEVLDFYLNVTESRASDVRIKITSADL